MGSEMCIRDSPCTVNWRDISTENPPGVYRFLLNGPCPNKAYYPNEKRGHELLEYTLQTLSSNGFKTYVSYCTATVSLASKGFPSGYSESARVRVSACFQKTPNLRGGFRKGRLTNTPRRHRLADGQLSSLYAPLPSFQLVWRRLFDDELFRSSCLFERTFCAARRSDWS